MTAPRDDDTVQLPAVTERAGGDTTVLPAVSHAATTGPLALGQVGQPGPLAQPARSTLPADGLAGGALLPMLDDPRRRFDTVMRGYDRHQVDAYVAKLEDDNRVLAGTRNESSSRVAELAAQVASAQSEIESLRRRLTAASETIDPDNVDVRVQEVVALAQQVARQTRADADADALRTRESATAAADTARAEARGESDQVVAAAVQRLAEADDAYTRRTAEADRLARETGERAAEELRLAREEVAGLRATADAEITTARAVSAEEIAAADSASSAARTAADRASREARETADAEAAARRHLAEEDFEITLRLRRRQEEDEDRERRAAALREASAVVADANDTADRIVRAARAEVERLDHERHRAHGDLRAVAERLTGIVTDHDPAVSPLATS